MSTVSTPEAVFDRRISLRWVPPLHYVNIIGIMGSGKTTLARKIYARYKWGKKSSEVVSVYFQYEHDKELHEEFWRTIARIRGKKYVFVVVDDVSFETGHDKTTRRFLRELSKIRHRNRYVKRWVLVTIIHYSKAAVPFLRKGHTKVLTSLTDPEEIEQLRWSFTTQALWDYYDVYRMDPTGHWVLFNWLGNIFISKIYKPARRCWDIVVNGPECV
ncbi:hypothetical protein [Pyrodictium delaneyi]|uniref:AAA+ ATPase domain-containing protein n=1 Tax=Pyrodictium delaneyi TaxID=1273541 RepID=A0A211YS21_9CREN|nr:hypothetical protein [Pyrodictium delaneyi]OWJ55617.1 hypothetical protein Pdsh_02185 [Pyrodictium delaneyi]